MNKALDQTSDINGQQLYRLSKLYPLPDFVKKASSNDVCGDDELQNHQYADPVHRQFPCHTASATYISALFFLDKKASMDPDSAVYLDGRIDDFAFFHGISGRINELRKKLAADKPESNLADLPDDSWALVLETKEGKSRHCPMRNALEVKRAAEYLKEHEQSFPYVYRQKIAEKILEKAEEFGAGLSDLDNYLQKQAGHGACAGHDAAKFMFDRARLLKQANKIEYAIKLAEIAKTIAGQPSAAHNQDQLVKLAGLVDGIDRETGLNRLIDDLPKPEDAFFGITVKIASELRESHFSTTSGNVYKLADVDNLKLADVRGLMGTDFADAISTGGLFVSPEKIAEIVPTLPRGDAELFDRLLVSVGISPVAKQAAAERGGFDSDELQALATLHQGIS